MGKKKGGGGDLGSQPTKEKELKEPKPKPKESNEGFKVVGKQGKPPKDDGFEVVVGKKEAKGAKRQAARSAAEQIQAEIVTREYPLHKDQVRPVLAKKSQIEDDSNARLTHKDAPFPGNPSTMVITGSTLGVVKAESMIAKLLKEVRHDEAIPTSKKGEPMIGVVIGPKGQNMERFRELAPNAKVQLPEEGGFYVSIYGQPADVQKIAAEMRMLHSGAKVDANQVELIQNQDTVTKTGKVPKDRSGKPLHWILIGKNGCNAKRIREETGAELVVPPQHSASDEYTIRGTVEAVELASRIIFELLEEELDKGSTRMDAPTSLQAPVAEAPRYSVPQDPLVVPSKTGAPTCVAPRLLRKAQGQTAPPPVPKAAPVAVSRPVKAMEPVELGSKMFLDMPLPTVAHSSKVKQRIKEVAADSNASIIFDGNNSLQLEGYEHCCRSAERAIMQLLGLTKAEVPIPRSRQGEPMIGLVIGPQGSIISDIRQRSGNAFVLLPDDGSGFAQDGVTIYGTPAEVEHAVEIVRAKLHISEDTVRRAADTDTSLLQVEMEVPCDRRGNPLLSIIIGTGGKNINWIREESGGVEIDIPKKREPGVPATYKLRGTEAQIRAAQRAIQQLFDDVDDQMASSYTPPPPNPYANCTIIGGR